MARKTHLKIRFVQELPMSQAGYKGWSPRLRSKVHKKVYKPVDYLTVPVEQLKNKEAIGKLAYDHLWEGTFIMMGYSHGKTRTHVKLVGLCRITLRIHDDKYDARVTHCKHARLSRYWFWTK